MNYFLRNCQTVLQSYYTILHSCQQCLRLPVPPQEKWYLVIMYYHFLIDSWISFAKILFRIIESMLRNDTDLQFSFLVVFFWFLCQDNAGLIECIQKYFLLLIFWKGLCRFGYFSIKYLVFISKVICALYFLCHKIFLTVNFFHKHKAIQIIFSWVNFDSLCLSRNLSTVPLKARKQWRNALEILRKSYFLFLVKQLSLR